MQDFKSFTLDVCKKIQSDLQEKIKQIPINRHTAEFYSPLWIWEDLEPHSQSYKKLNKDNPISDLLIGLLKKVISDNNLCYDLVRVDRLMELSTIGDTKIYYEFRWEPTKHSIFNSEECCITGINIVV